MDCILCQIAAKETPANTLYRDERIIVFPDINPLAPTHLLIVPKKHIPSLSQLSEGDSSLIRDMVNIANQLKSLIFLMLLVLENQKSHCCLRNSSRK